MGSFTGKRPIRSRRAVLVAVGATLFAAVLVVGLAFANSISVGRATENARALHWANASLGTAALARSALVQATTFVELAETGQVDPVDAAVAVEDAKDARERLFELLESGIATGSSAELNAFLDPVDAVIGTLVAGDYERAKNLVMVDLETSYIELTDSLEDELDSAQIAMDEHEAAGTRFSDFVRFFLTLAIPAAAVLIYRSVAKRQVREHKMKAQLELQAALDVSKAKDSFIAGLSHELRTPLTSIYGFAEVLTEGGAADRATTSEVSQIIANEASEMTRMVDDLLMAAKIDSTGVEVDMSPTRLSEVVESAIAPFEKAGLQVTRSPSQVVIDTDAARLRHVIVNLISNAAKHGGQNIGVAISYGEDVVDVEVWDDGPGVPEDKVANLFDKFVHSGSTPLLTGSVGLGLAVASCLSTMLGGKLAYQRFNGKTYFVVSLPLRVEVQEEPAKEKGSLATMVRALTT
ncbi:MAG: sensor histidine kinase [Actinobacteria bacterium]|nr:MAG: sensor histidine kinase [Actinomycetota bacterium]